MFAKMLRLINAAVSEELRKKQKEKTDEQMDR